jgi:transposase
MWATGNIRQWFTITRPHADGLDRNSSKYKGYLQVDAYPAYDKFFTDPERELVEVGCWAHARRHVFQARDTDPARRGAVLAYIAQLYAVEKRARLSGIQGHKLRLLRETASRPITHQLHAYLLSINTLLLPKSETGQAVAYLLKNWLALTRYLENGDLAIDNNRTERSLRGIAVGRHNWTFLGSDRGGKTMAILRSFVTSCELHKLDPFAWLRDVLTRIPSHSIQKLDQLLPHAWALPTS